jgi:hypothetical protein
MPDSCICVSESHEHGNAQCDKPAHFSVKVKTRRSLVHVGVCKDCYSKPYVELPLSLFDSEARKAT